MNTYRILVGDANEQLRLLPAHSVHCVVTSPPYYGLRDYGTGQWAGGDPICKHERTGENTRHEQCQWCGAVRVDRQLGQEPTVQEYIDNLVNVFREVRRVLREDGTLWLNLGDVYARRMIVKNNPQYKAKYLIGIPWRVAFAMQEDGWYLRSEIIWHKAAPMPESTMDRPVRSHEHIFLLSQSPRYYYDVVAVEEEAVSAGRKNWNRGTEGMDAGYDRHRTRAGLNRARVIGPRRRQRDVWFLNPDPVPVPHFATFPLEIPRRAILAGTSERCCCPECGAPWRRMGLLITSGFAPTCQCAGVEQREPVPCTVLDPFGGSGTTGVVALEKQRNAIICELSPEYAQIARERMASVTPLYTKETAQ